MQNAAARVRATPATTPITIPAMAPRESLCDFVTTADDDTADEEAEVDVGCEEEPVPVVEWTTATPRAKPSYGYAKAWADDSMAVKIELAFRAELS